MLSITIKNQTTKKIVVWGIGDYHTDRDDVTYINCSNENELLAKFMNFWINTIQILLLVGILNSLIFLILSIVLQKSLVKTEQKSFLLGG